MFIDFYNNFTKYMTKKFYLKIKTFKYIHFKLKRVKKVHETEIILHKIQSKINILIKK